MAYDRCNRLHAGAASLPTTTELHVGQITQRVSQHIEAEHRQADGESRKQGNPGGTLDGMRPSIEHAAP